MKKRIFAVLLVCLFLFAVSIQVFAHSGRTDSSGGHKDNKNKSGLGPYHYHCGGYPAHLHSGGVCPYTGGGSSSSSKPKTVYATKVSVSNMPTSILIGETVKLKGEAYPSNAVDRDISWSTSDSSIATVDVNGKLTAVGVGSVVISAKTSQGTTSKFNLKVKEITAESIELEGGKEVIRIGETLALSVNFTPENTTYKDLEWSTSDASVISVDASGKLFALKAGKATVSVKHKELTESFEIEVQPVLATDIEMFWIDETGVGKKDALRFEKGTVAELKAQVYPENATDKAVKWTVSSPEIAEVDANGVLTAIEEGMVTVTAETANGIKETLEVEIYKTSAIVDILAGVFVVIIVGVMFGGPIFLLVWIVKKIRKRKSGV